MWLFYIYSIIGIFFWGTLVITFIETANTVHIPPIRFESNKTYNDIPYKEEISKGMPLLKCYYRQQYLRMQI